MASNNPGACSSERCPSDPRVSLSTMVDEQYSQQEMAEERGHFKAVVNAFLYYRSYAVLRLKQVVESYGKLPACHRLMLKDYPEHCKDIADAVDKNDRFVKSIVQSAVGMFENSSVSNFDSSNAFLNVKVASQFYMDKVTTTIKQFYRDWSREGETERDMCYTPIVRELLERFPPYSCEVGKVSVLVPGAGLGRLAFNIAQHGYCCQGNEFSVFMLLGSNFILNQCKSAGDHVICPWVHQYSNLVSYKHQLAAISIPDVCPGDVKELKDFSMSAGDFLQVYTQPDEWDCVVCCFFLDTAHNVIQYLEKIFFILKPGGYWINFGPLLYHFSDMPSEFSIELSWEDIRRIAAEEIGFEMLKEETGIPSSYIQNPNSMMELSYKSAFLVARKPLDSRTDNACPSNGARPNTPSDDTAGSGRH